MFPEWVNNLYRSSVIAQTIYRETKRIYSRGYLKWKITRMLRQEKPCRVVLGAKGKFDDGWIRTEIYSLDVTKEKDWRRYFSGGSVAALLAEHVWEHLTLEEGFSAAKLCFKYLKEGGYLRIAVPDGFFPHPDYINFVRPGGAGPSAFDHKLIYNYKTLTQLLKRAGFDAELLEYFDEKGQFHYRSWEPSDGKIVRSVRFSHSRYFGGLNFRSLIIDAIKPSIKE